MDNALADGLSKEMNKYLDKVLQAGFINPFIFLKNSLP